MVPSGSCGIINVSSVKRDPIQRQKRPNTEAKKTCAIAALTLVVVCISAVEFAAIHLCIQKILIFRQKRPDIEVKETYY